MAIFRVRAAAETSARAYQRTARVAGALVSVAIVATSVMAPVAHADGICDLVGEGTAGNPFQVRDAVDLEKVGRGAGGCTLDAHYKQVANIIVPVPVGDDFANFTPIATVHPFTGVYDGNGHSITGLRIGENNVYASMFGVISGGTVRDLAFVNVEIRGASRVGVVAGSMSDGAQLLDVHVDQGDVHSNDGRVGGLVGETSDAGDAPSEAALATLTNVSFKGSVVNASSKDYAGGLVGRSGRRTVFLNASFDGTVVSDGRLVGGVAGYAFRSQLFNTTATGQINGDYVPVGDFPQGYVGGVVGYLRLSFALGARFDGSVIGKADDIGGAFGRAEDTGLVDVRVNGNVTGLQHVGGVFGTVSDSTQTGAVYVGTVTGTGAGFVGGIAGLVADSDFVTLNATATVIGDRVAGTAHVGGLFGEASDSGVVTAVFAGSVSGTGDYVGAAVGRARRTPFQNVTINAPVDGTNFVGGFAGRTDDVAIAVVAIDSVVAGTGSRVGGVIGYAMDTTLSAVDFEGTVSGTANIGGAIGYANRAQVLNLVVTGSVTGSLDAVGGAFGYGNTAMATNVEVTATVRGRGQVGGVVGYSNTTQVADAVVDVTVEATSANAGGISGIVDAASTITSSTVTGDITGTSNVGGAAGRLDGVIGGVVSSANVTGTGNNVGGLIGSITSSGAAVSVAAVGSVVTTGENVGGLVGRNKGVVWFAYAKGTVTGTTSVGGLVGLQQNAENFNVAQVDRSYATGLVTATDAVPAVGGLVGFRDPNAQSPLSSFWDVETSGVAAGTEGTPKTSSQMRSLATYNNLATVGLDDEWLITQGWQQQAFFPGAPVFGICDGVNDGYPFLLFEYVADPCPVVAGVMEPQPVTEVTQRSVVCTPTTPVVGEEVVCVLSGGGPGELIVWQALVNPVFANGTVQLDQQGNGQLMFQVPNTALGRQVSVAIDGWFVSVMSAAVSGASGFDEAEDSAQIKAGRQGAMPPTPTGIPAGEGMTAQWALWVLMLFGLLSSVYLARPRREQKFGSHVSSVR